METREAVVQGDSMTGPNVAQICNDRTGEEFVAVPRALLADFAPRNENREPVLISSDEPSQTYREQAQLITDPAQASRACQVRGAAQRYATPRRELGANT
jgi:hypothetical protein